MADTVRTETFTDRPEGREYPGDWWNCSDTEIGPAMVQVAERMKTALGPRGAANLRYARLFLNKYLAHIEDMGRARSILEDVAQPWNVCQAGVNTAKSMVARNRPRTVFETMDGDHALQMGAKKAGQFVFGALSLNKWHENQAKLTFLDGSVFGLGPVFVGVEDEGEGESEEGGASTLVVERALPDEVIFSEDEARRGKPHQLFREMWIARHKALEFCKTEEERLKVKAIRGRWEERGGAGGYVADLVPIYEGWYLGKKGKHVIALPGLTVRVRPWKHKRFPVSFFRFEDALAGLYGIGVVERLVGYQVAINEINEAIAECVRRCAPKWMVETGSAVNPDDLDNEIAGIVEYATTAPQLVALEAIPRGLLEERDRLYQQALREIGLSEWSVNAVKPEGVSSGEALRTVRQQEQGRLIDPGQDWETMHCDLAEVIVMVAADAAERKRTLKVKASDPGAKFVAEIEWKDIAPFIAKGQYQVKAYPVSMLPISPEGRLQKLEEWRDKGIIDNAQFAQLSEMPDLDRQMGLMNAAIENLRYCFGRMTEADVFIPPDETDALELGIRMAHAEYQRAKRQKVPERRLDNLLRWIDEANELLAKAQPAGQSAQGSAAPPPIMESGLVKPASPMGNPGPVPVDPAAAAGLPPGVNPDLTSDVAGAAMTAAPPALA